MYPKRNVYTQWRRISCFIVLMGGLNQPLRQTNRAINRLRRVKIYFRLGREGVVSGNRNLFYQADDFRRDEISDEANEEILTSRDFV